MGQPDRRCRLPPSTHALYSPVILIRAGLYTGLVSEPNVTGVALLTQSGTVLTLHGDLATAAQGDSNAVVDWAGFSAAADAILNSDHDNTDPERAQTIAAGLVLGDMHFALVRVELADLDAAGVGVNRFMRLAILPYRLRLLVLSEKGLSNQVRRAVDAVVVRVRA